MIQKQWYAKFFGYYIPIVMCLLYALPLRASNGFFLPAYGARYAGMGGASLALGGSIMDLQANPSLLAWRQYAALEGGVNLLFGTLTYKDVSTLPGIGYSNAVDAPIVAPLFNLGFSMPLSQNMGFGLAIYTQGGGGVTMSGVKSIFPAGASILQTTEDLESVGGFIKLTPGFGMAFGDLAIGIALDLTLAQQKSITTYKLAANGSELAKVNYQSDNALSLGAKLGLTYKITENWSVAYAYMTPSGFDLGGTLEVSSAGTTAGSAAQTRFELPARHSFGVSYHQDALTVAFDAHSVGYASKFSTSTLTTEKSIIPGASGQTNRSVSRLGFKDQFIVALGAEYKPGDVAFRAGFNHGNTPIPASSVSPANNLIIENHILAGIGWWMGNVGIDVAAEFSPSSSLTGENSSDWGLQHGLNLTPGSSYSISGGTYGIHVSLTYKF